MQELVAEASLETEISAEFTERERTEGLDADAVFQDYLDIGGSPFFYITLKVGDGISSDEQMGFLNLLSRMGFQCNVVFRTDMLTFYFRICGDYSIQEYD